MRVQRWIAATALATAGLAIAGCGCIEAFARRHAIYRPSGEEAAAIADFVGGLGAAIERGDTSPFQQRLDPQGRRGLLIFATEMAYENDAKIRGYVELGSLVLVLAMGVEVLAKSCPVEVLDLRRGLGWLLRRIGQSLRADLGSLLPELDADDGPRSLVARLGPGSRFGDLGARLRDLAGTARGCHYVEPTLSFRAWLLRHHSWGLAERSHTFREWKAHIEEVHAAHLACDGQDALVILTSYGGPLKLAEWHLFPSAQWPAVQSRLEEIERGVRAGRQSPDRPPGDDTALREAIDEIRRHARDGGPSPDGG